MDAVMGRPRQSPWRDLLRTIAYERGFERGMIMLRQGKGTAVADMGDAI